jgi:TPR repeat protein
MDKHLYDVISYLAELGIEDSMKQIVAEVISNGYDAVNDEQAETILRYLDILEKKDDQYALLALGTMYYSGMGDYVQQDYSKALHYYEKAAEKSELTDIWALNNLGYCYYYGRAGILFLVSIITLRGFWVRFTAVCFIICVPYFGMS